MIVLSRSKHASFNEEDEDGEDDDESGAFPLPPVPVCCSSFRNSPIINVDSSMRQVMGMAGGLFWKSENTGLSDNAAALTISSVGFLFRDIRKKNADNNKFLHSKRNSSS